MVNQYLSKPLFNNLLQYFTVKNCGIVFLLLNHFFSFMQMKNVWSLKKNLDAQLIFNDSIISQKEAVIKSLENQLLNVKVVNKQLEQLLELNKKTIQNNFNHLKNPRRNLKEPKKSYIIIEKKIDDAWTNYCNNLRQSKSLIISKLLVKFLKEVANG